MTEHAESQEAHLREIRALKRRYTVRDTCPACGIIRERLPVGPLEPADNGVCCVACLQEYPELAGLSRDEVALWLWENWQTSLHGQGGNGSGQTAAGVARTWLRVQAAQGRTDESMADVAAAAYGLSHVTRDRLRQYVREMAGVTRDARPEREGVAAS